MPPEMLSPHLSVAEFLATSHADMRDDQRLGWEQPGVRERAQRFAVSVFERARAYCGPLFVTSGYRCGALNRAVGGRPTSRHVLGMAADVQPLEISLDEAMERIVRAIKAGAFPDLDEAIIERGTWIHLQGAPVGKAPRLLALETDDGVSFRPYKGAA